jgi:hypothetical protein
MTSKENKRKYAKEEEVCTTTLKKRWAFGDDSSLSEEEVSSEEEPARWARSDDGDTTDSRTMMTMAGAMTMTTMGAMMTTMTTMGAMMTTMTAPLIS